MLELIFLSAISFEQKQKVKIQKHLREILLRKSCFKAVSS